MPPHWDGDSDKGNRESDQKVRTEHCGNPRLGIPGTSCHEIVGQRLFAVLDDMSRFYKERLTFPSGAEERPDCAVESTLAPTKSTHLSETPGDSC
jgi:hypothetical protein